MGRVEELIARKRVRDSVLACHACALHTDTVTPVPFDGPSPCDTVIVGEAPGGDENMAGRPFVGPAGRLLRGYLRHHGLDDRVAYVNAVSCFPHRTPTAREVDACSGNLVSQMGILSPRHVLLVGGIALSAFWKGERITDVRGNWWVADEVSYLATWHPAAVLRNNDLSDEFRVDIGDFVEVVKGAKPWKKWWCTKCNKEAKHWRSPHGGSLGVPYCQACYQATVGVAMPKGGSRSRSKSTKKNTSQSQSLL